MILVMHMYQAKVCVLTLKKQIKSVLYGYAS